VAADLTIGLLAAMLALMGTAVYCWEYECRSLRTYLRA
jgi:hypothetical protein